jgi:phosphoribosyl-ATP pyrophosphohydrolase
VLLYKGVIGGEGMANVFREIYEEIVDRKQNPVAESYTNYLFTKGEDKILKKIGEECTEVVIAAKGTNKEELVSELMDLTYHCLVLLAEKNISLEDLEEEANRRRGKLSKVGDRKEIDTL